MCCIQCEWGCEGGRVGGSEFVVTVYIIGCNV